MYSSSQLKNSNTSNAPKILEVTFTRNLNFKLENILSIAQKYKLIYIFENIVGLIAGNILVEFYMLWFAYLNFSGIFEGYLVSISFACSI